MTHDVAVRKISLLSGSCNRHSRASLWYGGNPLKLTSHSFLLRTCGFKTDRWAQILAGPCRQGFKKDAFHSYNQRETEKQNFNPTTATLSVLSSKRAKVCFLMENAFVLIAGSRVISISVWVVGPINCVFTSFPTGFQRIFRRMKTLKWENLIKAFTAKCRRWNCGLLPFQDKSPVVCSSAHTVKKGRYIWLTSFNYIQSRS